MRTRQTIRENVNVNEKSYLSFAAGTSNYTSTKYHKDTVQLGTEYKKKKRGVATEPTSSSWKIHEI